MRAQNLFAALLVLCALPATADVTYSYPQPPPLPDWVQSVTRAIEWISSLAPSGGPSDAVSSALFLLLGLVAGAAAPALRRALTRRSERIAADEVFRRLEAKKLNEHIKLLGSLCNTVGAAIIGTAFIAPYIGNSTPPAPGQLWWFVVGAAFPIIGHVALRFLRSEI